MEQLTPEQIDEIVENIEAGKLCFYRIIDGDILVLPEESEHNLQHRKQLLDIEKQMAKYLSFEKMSSRQVFDTMRDFALSLDHDIIKENLLLSLEKEHPISRFKESLQSHPEAIAEDWLAFKKHRDRKWVEEQVELYDLDS